MHNKNSDYCYIPITNIHAVRFSDWKSWALKNTNINSTVINEQYPCICQRFGSVQYSVKNGSQTIHTHENELPKSIYAHNHHKILNFTPHYEVFTSYIKCFNKLTKIKNVKPNVVALAQSLWFFWRKFDFMTKNAEFKL